MYFAKVKYGNEMKKINNVIKLKHSDIRRIKKKKESCKIVNVFLTKLYEIIIVNCKNVINMRGA